MKKAVLAKPHHKELTHFSDSVSIDDLFFHENGDHGYAFFFRIW